MERQDATILASKILTAYKSFEYHLGIGVPAGAFSQLGYYVRSAFIIQVSRMFDHVTLKTSHKGDLQGGHLQRSSKTESPLTIFSQKEAGGCDIVFPHFQSCKNQHDLLPHGCSAWPVRHSQLEMSVARVWIPHHPRNWIHQCRCHANHQAIHSPQERTLGYQFCRQVVRERT